MRDCRNTFGSWSTSPDARTLVRLSLSTLLAGAALVASEPASNPPAGQTSAQTAALPTAPPRVTELPPDFRPIEGLANRGRFYAAGGAAAARMDDGGTHHGGSANLASWAGLLAKGIQNRGTQGIIYRLEDGAVTAAGYLIRQADLIGGKSFHGLTFGMLRFPAPDQLTIDLLKGPTEDANQYLWLWHFRTDSGGRTLAAGELPSVASLPKRFAVTGADVHPNAFYPRMGRHRRDAATAGHRAPGARGDAAVLYGEAAGKLIFVEYTFDLRDFASGASWPAMPLNGVPIPPIDNVHIIHSAAASGAPEYFTVHMYFIPEETYLRWETEPTEILPAISSRR